jgi:hypothetical protein
MTLSIQTKKGPGLIYLLLAIHGHLELEPNMMVVTVYIFC